MKTPITTPQTLSPSERMRRGISYGLIALLLSIATPIRAQLGQGAFASLLTCGAGDAVETFFGHSALRICDTSQGIDWVYNYGTYDFEQPHFYWSFVRGYLRYSLSRTTFTHFMKEYSSEQRSVDEQRLLLDNQQTGNLYTMLQTNMMPEYRYYRYNFFDDNCATRPRDVLIAIAGHRHIEFVEPVESTTYRDIMYEATQHHLWWRLALDMVLGVRSDRRCDAYRLMFAPKVLHDEVEQARVDDTARLAQPSVSILPGRSKEAAIHTTPLVSAWCLCLVVLALTLLALRHGWSLRWLDCILFALLFILSLLLLFLWLGTTHYYTAWNANLLWASPLMLYFLIKGSRSRRWLTGVQLLMLLAATLMAITAWPQQLNSAILPLCLLIATRLLHQTHRGMSKDNLRWKKGKERNVK